MDRETAVLGTLIALLRRQGIAPLAVKEQILEGIRVAKELSVEEAIQKESADEPINEEAVVEISKTATDGAGAYVEIVSWTVTSGRIGILNKLEMASADYTNVQFRLTVADKVVFEDKELPNTTTITLPNLQIRAGKLTKIEAKDTDSTAHNVWGDISGKEVVL